jgi:predicted Holliday junction resolvase-like endonuclease
MTLLLITITIVALCLYLISESSYKKLKQKYAENSHEVNRLRGYVSALQTQTVNVNDVVSKDIFYDTENAYKNQLLAASNEINRVKLSYKILQEEHEALSAKLKDQLSNKKSQEVRLGQIAEQLIPFLKNFKHDPKTLCAVFRPIDYIVFGEDEIVFLEVKTGGAQLSQKQKNIKELVEQKKVRFEVHRIDENSYEVEK